MTLDLFLTIALEVLDAQSSQQLVAAELRKHADFLESGPVGQVGTEGAVTWDAVLSE